MVERSGADLDEVFRALAHPTRRDMLQRLRAGERSVSELGAPYAMSLEAASKHVRVLERADLVRRTVRGRRHLCRLHPQPLAELRAWLDHYQRFWDQRLEALEAALRSDQGEEPTMTDEDLTVSVSRELDVTPERAFDAWLDPGMVEHWFAPGLGPMTRVEIDARVGGAFHLDQRRGEEVARHWGRYLEIDRPRRLAFTWSVDGADGEDVVTIDIEPLERGCRVTVSHRLEARYAEYAEPTRRGWATMLKGLADGLAQGPRGAP